MISILLMVAATLLVIFLLYLTLTAPQENVIEIITSRSWYYNFLSGKEGELHIRAPEISQTV